MLIIIELCKWPIPQSHQENYGKPIDHTKGSVIC